MFLNARGCWKNNLCQRIGFTGPSDAVTEQECMDRAMCIFLGFFNESLKYGSYWHVVTLYQSVLAVEHDQGMNEYGRAVLKRLKFLIKHAHCKHYCNVLYPTKQNTFCSETLRWQWVCTVVLGGTAFYLLRILL